MPTLVTNRAIQRVIDKQKLHHRLLRFYRAIAVRVHHHALRHGRGASWQWFRRFFDLNQAHAAVGRDAEFAVVAKMRHMRADLLGSVHHRAAFGDFNFFAVKHYLYHATIPTA